VKWPIEARDRKIDEMLMLTPGMSRSDVQDVRRELRRLGWRRTALMIGVTVLFVAACFVVGAIIKRWP
jgi:hypothetical protein